MDTWIKKIEIKVVLFALGFTKKASQSLRWVILQIVRIIQFILVLFVKKVIIPIIVLLLKVRKIIKKTYSSFHYLEGNAFLKPQKILVVFLALFLIFVFFESKSTFQEEFFAQAATIDENSNSSADFKIAAEENEETLKPINTLNSDFVPTRTEIEKYAVEAGDTISSIAEDFGVSINTILWENNLSPYSLIRAGQVLKILPVSGVSYKVKRGDTITKIAQVYRADSQDIINFNDLESDPMKAGDVIIIPEGKIPPPPPAPRIATKPSQQNVRAVQFDGQTRVGTNCRNFYPGQCTWYVAQKYCIPWSGHAKSWLANAKSYGWAIGKTPQAGAILSRKETWYGHVVIVKEVKTNTIIISEMNYLGPWKVSEREISINDWRNNGYIYPP